MRALFTGLGSIGTRHLGNLYALCREKDIPLEVTALRSGGEPLPALPPACVPRQVRVLPPGEEYDLAFITNPTHLHAVTIGELSGRVQAFFIEKPIFDHPGYQLAALGLKGGQKAYVAAPMRWTKLFLELKEWLRRTAMPIYSARAICSSYLPEWRQGTDYRAGYSAHKEMGGGVTLDLIHEWDYLYALFGPPLACYNLRGKLSGLEINSDDLSVYIAKWPSLFGELHLDYFGRAYRRELELFCPEGSLVADFASGRLSLPGGETQEYGEEANMRYRREMDYFITYALAGVHESLNSPQRALEVLKIAWGAAGCQSGC